MAETSESSSWGKWPRWGDEPSTQQIEEEIAEELQLHFDLMVEEEHRKGASLDEAKWRATEKFGNRERIAAECKQIRTWERVMLQRIQVSLVSLLIIFMGISYLKSMSLSTQLAVIENQLNEFKESIVPTTKEEKISNEGGFSGEDIMEILVCDEKGEPIPNALLIIWWANPDFNRYDEYRRKTDDGGKLKILRDNSRVITSLSAYAKGKTLTTLSLTQSRQDYFETQKIMLKPALTQKLTLYDETGKPLQNATVYMESRTDTLGLSNYSVYGPHFAARSLGLSAKTDLKGNVEIDWFAEGDSAKIQVTCPTEEGTVTYRSDLEVAEKKDNPISVQMEKKGVNPFQNLGFGGGE